MRDFFDIFRTLYFWLSLAVVKHVSRLSRLMRKNNAMKEKRLCAAQEDGSADMCLNDTITINREEFTGEIDHVCVIAFENALWFKMFVSLTAKTDK